MVDNAENLSHTWNTRAVHTSLRENPEYRRMSDRDRGQRGREGFREGMRPLPSGNQYMSEQYNVGTNYDR